MSRCWPLLFLLLLHGCFGPSPRMGAVNDYMPDEPNSAAGPFEHIAYYGSWLAGVLVLAGIVMMWFRPAQAPRVIFIGLSILIGAQAMLWISAHLGLITIIMILAGALYGGYLKRDEIIDAFDGETTAELKPTPFTEADDGATPEPDEFEEPRDTACISGSYLR